MKDYGGPDALVILPNSILGRLVGNQQQAATGFKRRLVFDLVFGRDGLVLRPFLHRWYNDRVGGLVLYALGVRPQRELERQARARRRGDGF